jgi:hypothetical protein
MSKNTITIVKVPCFQRDPRYGDFGTHCTLQILSNDDVTIYVTVWWWRNLTDVLDAAYHKIDGDITE